MREARFLIVVDMQNDFIDGSLGTAEAQAIVDRAAEHIRRAMDEGVTVIATLDTHTPDYINTSEGRHLPVVHCVKGTPGWQLNPKIEAALKDAVRVEKPTFGSVRLPQIIREKTGGEAPAEIELLGLCTDICVVSNALLLKAAFPETDFTVHADCCAGVTPEKHAAALETMRSCQITII
jgi:nicotinamidase-related amidase